MPAQVSFYLTKAIKPKTDKADCISPGRFGN